MDVKSISKKQNHIIFGITCLFSFMMGCYFFSTLFANEYPSIKLPTTVVSIKTGSINPILTGSTVVTKPKLSTNTVSYETSTTWESEDTNQEWTQPILNLWQVSAWYYEWATVFERVKSRVISIWVDTWTAEFITWKCFDSAIDSKHCVKSVIWVATPESSLFKRCKDNNCMWIKPWWELKWYATLNLALDDRINRYNKYRYKNNSGKDWIIRSHYCKWDCSDLADWWSNWTRAFDWAVKKLWI